MVSACESIVDTIGGTPTVTLSRLSPPGAGEVRLKLEHFSPTGSTFDRAAKELLGRAEAGGQLRAGGAVVEATFGNTGAALAMLCAARGYRLLIAIPGSATIEARQLLEAYGAEVSLTPASAGIEGSRETARQLAAKIPGAHFLDQLSNPTVLEAHATAAAELLETVRADGGRIDAFVLGVGSGAAISAYGRALKAAFGAAEIIAVEPESAAGHSLPGLGGPSPLLDRAMVDRVVLVGEREAWRMKQRLGREEGLLVGPSTGANVAAAAKLALEKGSGCRVYTVAVDTGERYFSLSERFE